MKIIYFTTSMDADSFKQFSSRWLVALNPSNQNFHNKMIRSFAVSNEVTVISIRPFSNRNCKIDKLTYEKKETGNITWHYLEIPINKIFRIKKCYKQAVSLLKKEGYKEAIFVTDTINPTVLTVANKVKEKLHRPLVGICTDSPSNISGTLKSYTLYLLNSAKSLDGYISLTDGLNDLFNVDKKPSLIIEGVVENILPTRDENLYGRYIFFGGALMERYGVYDLIDAFKFINSRDLKLLICGHHCNETMMKTMINDNPNIQYLGILPVKNVLRLEQNALMNINPRPYSEDLDRYSIPSKTIEYLSTGVPTISVKNTKLEKYFKNEIIWAKSNSAQDLAEAINTVLKMSQEERKELGFKAKEKVMDLYSLTSVNKKLDAFLSQFIK